MHIPPQFCILRSLLSSLLVLNSMPFFATSDQYQYPQEFESEIDGEIFVADIIKVVEKFFYCTKLVEGLTIRIVEFFEGKKMRCGLLKLSESDIFITAFGYRNAHTHIKMTKLRFKFGTHVKIREYPF